MQTQEQVVPIRTPEASTHGDVFTVIGKDGRANPDTDPKLAPAFVIELYKAMLRTREIDFRLERLQRQGRIGFHIGSVGEEACIIGSAAAMRKKDWIFPCYREFGALLYKGMPLQTYMHNMYGNAADPALGRQMPDHYTGREYNFGSVSSPIGTQMTQAVGLAWAAKMKKDPIAVGVYFGDGATSSNEFHTSMNFAGVFKTPVVFLCRNNHWAISVPTERQTASDGIAMKAEAYGMKGIRVDGNDVLATYKIVRDAVQRAVSGEGPTLIEMMTYRIGGHSTSDDPRAYRLEAEVDEWRQMDPMLRLRQHLEVLKIWDEDKETTFKAEVAAELKVCIEASEAMEKPPLGSLFDGVFAERPWHLEEQAQELLNGPRAKSHH